MCNPALVLVSAGMQAYGTLQQGKAAQGQANQAAQQDELSAYYEREAADAEAANIRKVGRIQRGETLAATAASGVKIGEGSALDAEREVLQNSEHDATMALLTGARRSTALKDQAALTRKAGRRARAAAGITAATSLLQSGSNFANASGWRSSGPGFSGTQAPAPVESRNIPRG
jgi:hypothetical protein